MPGRSVPSNRLVIRSDKITHLLVCLLFLITDYDVITSRGSRSDSPWVLSLPEGLLT